VLTQLHVGPGGISFMLMVFIKNALFKLFALLHMLSYILFNKDLAPSLVKILTQIFASLFINIHSAGSNHYALLFMAVLWLFNSLMYTLPPGNPTIIKAGQFLCEAIHGLKIRVRMSTVSCIFDIGKLNFSTSSNSYFFSIMVLNFLTLVSVSGRCGYFSL